METTLITGGAGFIGSALTEMLLAQGQRVRIFDNFRRGQVEGKPFAGHAHLEVIRGDVLEDLADLRGACQGVQRVIHCAAVAGIDTVIKSPTTTLRVNLLGTANALQAAHEAGGVQQFVNFSTSEVFGTTVWGAVETDRSVLGSVGEARWSYAVGKVAGEHLAHAYWQEFRLPTVTVRPFNIYGPGQVGEGAIQIFVRQALRGEDLVIHGEGNQIRAWCYIDDFIRGLDLIFHNPDAIGESFNLGNSRAVVTIYGLAEAIIRITGSSSRIRFEPARSADVELRVPRVDKARRILGFEAQVDLEEGIRRTADWVRDRL
ncbi:MAG: NAD-dependent epimerase/dehydratase family protein [Candidatus Eremiobacterota bacterium]